MTLNRPSFAFCHKRSWSIHRPNTLSSIARTTVAILFFDTPNQEFLDQPIFDHTQDWLHHIIHKLESLLIFWN